MHKTDKDGNLTIPGIPTEKSITFSFSKEGYNTQSPSKKIPAEEEYVLEKDHFVAKNFSACYHSDRNTFQAKGTRSC